MIKSVLRKLEHHHLLSTAETQALAEAIARPRYVKPHEDLVSRGDSPGRVTLLLDGFATRYKTLEDGRRQILGLLVPGDFCDLHSAVLGRMDHSIATVSPATVATMRADVVEQLSTRHSSLAHALLWCTLIDDAITREWVVNLGRRTAYERTAHFFCEIHARLAAVGLSRGSSCRLPLTQTELGETLGISTVHVNRTLQELRRKGLVTIRGGELTIHDHDQLMADALFDPDYLYALGQKHPPTRNAANG